MNSSELLGRRRWRFWMWCTIGTSRCDFGISIWCCCNTGGSRWCRTVAELRRKSTPHRLNITTVFTITVTITMPISPPPPGSMSPDSIVYLPTVQHRITYIPLLYPRTVVTTRPPPAIVPCPCQEYEPQHRSSSAPARQYQHYQHHHPYRDHPTAPNEHQTGGNTEDGGA
jgi:hypothetical protein